MDGRRSHARNPTPSPGLSHTHTTSMMPMDENANTFLLSVSSGRFPSLNLRWNWCKQTPNILLSVTAIRKCWKVGCTRCEKTTGVDMSLFQPPTVFYCLLILNTIYLSCESLFPMHILKETRGVGLQVHRECCVLRPVSEAIASFATPNMKVP